MYSDLFFIYMSFHSSLELGNILFDKHIDSHRWIERWLMFDDCSMALFDVSSSSVHQRVLGWYNINSIKTKSEVDIAVAAKSVHTMPLECICMTYTTSNPECSFQIGMVWITIYPWMSIYDSFKMDEYSEHNMFKTSKQVTFQFPIRIDWMDNYCLDSNRLIWSPDKQTVAKRMSILFMWTWPECAVRSWPAMISSVTDGWIGKGSGSTK